MNKKDTIIKISKASGIDIIGFTALDFTDEIVKKEQYLKSLGYLTPFHKEFDPLEYSDYKTAIVIGVSYYNRLIENINELEKDKVYFSMSSWGEDYHKVLREKLMPISDYLKENKYITKICVDNNSLDERFFAYKAGLGFYGINGNIINEELGSYFFIGVLLTDAIIEPDETINKKCISCMSCVNECPSGAINENGLVNGNRCLSYLTQKKELEESEKSIFNNCIYGCDICSRVCPHNSNIKESNNFPLLGIEFINIKEYKPLSNKEFIKKYGNLSGAWRGKKIIERNIDIYKEKLEKERVK